MNCDDSYKGTSLEGKVNVEQGIQEWTVPATGLYLFTGALLCAVVLSTNNTFTITAYKS